MKTKLRKLMTDVSAYIELILSAVLSIVIVGMIIKLIGQGYNSFTANGVELEYFLKDAMTLAIGVEFVKMLCTHTPNTIIEVLMFAIARHLVVEHPSINETAIGVLAIAGLFAIRKFLTNEPVEDEAQK